MSSRTRRPWRRPLQLAALTAVGLLSALLGTGMWRWLAWLCLGLPILAAVLAWMRRDNAPDA